MIDLPPSERPTVNVSFPAVWRVVRWLFGRREKAVALPLTPDERALVVQDLRVAADTIELLTVKLGAQQRRIAALEFQLRVSNGHED